MVDFFSGIKVNYVSHYDDNVVPKAVHARADPNVSAHISVLWYNLKLHSEIEWPSFVYFTALFKHWS